MILRLPRKVVIIIRIENVDGTIRDAMRPNEEPAEFSRLLANI